jgi:phage gpG-like protein
MSVKGPDLKLVVTKLDKLGPAIIKAAGRGLDIGLRLVAREVEERYLMGPRPERLGVVTGRLKGSITTSVRASGAGIVGKIGTNVPYGAYHEFGFDGPVAVKEHQRKGKLTKGGETMVYSRRLLMSLGMAKKYQIRDASGRTVGWKRVRKEDLEARGFGVTLITVKAHTRKAKVRPRPFIGPALEAGAPVITQEVNREILKAFGELGATTKS